MRDGMTKTTTLELLVIIVGLFCVMTIADRAIERQDVICQEGGC